MLLQIDGWYGAGKSVLTGLLDNHPDISSNPIHDATHMMALHHRFKDICSSKDTESLRRALIRTQYYIIEKSANQGFGNISFGAGNDIKSDFTMSFYDFDKYWIHKLNQLSEWTPESIIELIYQSYSKFLLGKENYNYNLSMGWPLIELQKDFFKIFPNGKTIIVDRSIEEIIAVRSGRKARKGINDSFFAPKFESLIKHGEVQKIKLYKQFINKMAKDYPYQFMVIDFRDLIDKETRIIVMNDISSFLGIKFFDKMLKWTFLGREVKYKGMSYVDIVLDNPEDILTFNQLNQLTKEIKKNREQSSLKISNLFHKTGTLFQLIAEKLE